MAFQVFEDYFYHPWKRFLSCWQNSPRLLQSIHMWLLITPVTLLPYVWIFFLNYPLQTRRVPDDRDCSLATYRTWANASTFYDSVCSYSVGQRLTFRPREQERQDFCFPRLSPLQEPSPTLSEQPKLQKHCFQSVISSILHQWTTVFGLNGKETGRVDAQRLVSMKSSINSS